MVSISFRSSSTFCCSLFNTLCLVSVDLSLQDPLQKLLKLLLTFILIQPAVQKFCHVCLLCEKSGTPASIVKILQEDPGKLIFYIGMRLMIQCQEIIFEGFPGTPLFLPDISQKLVYLSLAIPYGSRKLRISSARYSISPSSSLHRILVRPSASALG